MAFAIRPDNGIPAALSMRLYSWWYRAMRSIVLENVVVAIAAATGKKPTE
jgi:hypothetical protein